MLRSVQHLVAPAEARHFRRAAELCHTSQSTLNIQLKKLEGYLDVTLFKRNNRHSMPMPVGRQMISLARVILAYTVHIKAIANDSLALHSHHGQPFFSLTKQGYAAAH